MKKDANQLLIVFGGVTDRLIPLFALGAFLAFTLSQAGMVAHWRKSSAAERHHSLWTKLASRGLRFAIELSPDVHGLHILTQDSTISELTTTWEELVAGPARAAGRPAPNNNRGAWLRTLLRLRGGPRVVVVNTPFHLAD